MIRGKPERAPNTQETGSSLYVYIYLYTYLWVILHRNDLMHMLKHYVCLLERDW